MFPEVEETIVAYNEATRTLSYVGAGLPAFVAEARNRWEVTPIDDHHARVRLDATVQTRGILGQLLAVPFRLWARRSGARMLDDLKHYVEHGRPSPHKERQLGRTRERPAAALPQVARERLGLSSEQPRYDSAEQLPGGALAVIDGARYRLAWVSSGRR
jgi:hypothetical protein